jgi:hypothetical protein
VERRELFDATLDERLCGVEDLDFERLRLEERLGGEGVLTLSFRSILTRFELCVSSFVLDVSDDKESLDFLLSNLYAEEFREL